MEDGWHQTFIIWVCFSRQPSIDLKIFWRRLCCLARVKFVLNQPMVFDFSILLLKHAELQIQFADCIQLIKEFFFIFHCVMKFSTNE